jgi:molecular chaperone DnaJ
MSIKDYYAVLHLPPHATVVEIKQAYRKLAMIHHPDKNGNDPYAIAEFNEIKEAYEVLTHPVRKELWLQERWYDQAIGTKRKSVVINPVNVLRLVLDLEKYVSKLDVHRMNHEALSGHVNELFSTDTIEKLKAFNESAINRQIIATGLSAIMPLKRKHTAPLLNKFELLGDHDEIALQKIKAFRVRQTKDHLWNRWGVFAIFLATALICLLIYFTSK